MRTWRKMATRLDEYVRKVQATITSLNTTYHTLRTHSLITADDTSAESVATFEKILNRSPPVTEAEKWITATMRVVCDKNRAAFYTFISRNQMSGVSQLIDGALVANLLNASDSFTITLGDDGQFRVNVGERGPTAHRAPRERRDAPRERRDAPRDRREPRGKAPPESGPKGKHGRKKDYQPPRRNRPPERARPTMSPELYNHVLNDVTDAARAQNTYSGPTPYKDALVGQPDGAVDYGFADMWAPAGPAQAPGGPASTATLTPAKANPATARTGPKATNGPATNGPTTNGPAKMRWSDMDDDE